ncbi:MAG: DCC1-like thiol-disulfide oxidoreductase family protein [Verrucomicrobiota bacterium]
MNDTASPTPRGKLFYDATCNFCTRSVARVRPFLDRRGVEAEPFADGASEQEMKLAWSDGSETGGVDAAISLAGAKPRTAPIGWIARIPGIYHVLRAGYRYLAKRRSCIGGACEIDLTVKRKPPRWLGWVGLVVPVAIAVAANLFFPIAAWVGMWLLAGAIWIGFKWMGLLAAGGWREVNVLYYLFWVGTDAKPFRHDAEIKHSEYSSISDVVLPVIFLIVGTILFFTLDSWVTNPYALGWIGVVAMLMVLHFGSFALLSASWNAFGFPVQPIMNAPWAAKQLGEFWGPRWNRAFSDWARINLFRPLVRKFGILGGTMAGFFASGLAHELVISFPARGGWGLPTIYFLLQGLFIIAQRKWSALLENRFVTLAIVLLPAPFLLFHPPFVDRVFAPMVRAISGLI